MGPCTFAGTTARYDLSFSRRDAPGVLLENLALEIRGRREDRVRAAPAVSRAISIKKCAHEHTGQRRTLRPSLRNGFTAGDRPSCHHHLQEALASRRLDVS